MNKDAFKKYIGGIKYLMTLQWQTSRWLTAWQFMASILTGISQVGSSYLNALILAQFALLVIGQTEVRTVVLIIIARVLYQFVINIIYSVDNYLQIKINNLMEIKIQERIFRQVHDLDQEQLESEEYNPLITRVTEDMHRMNMANRHFATFIGDFFGFAAAIVSLIVIQPVIGLIVAVMAIPLGIMEVRVSKMRRDSYNLNESDLRIRSSVRWYATDYTFIPELKILNGLPSLLKIYWQHSKNIIKVEERVEREGLKAKIVNDFGQLIVLLGGDVWLVFRAAAGTMSLDTILFARNLIQNAVNSSGVIASSTQGLSESIIYLGDLQNFLELEPAIKDGSIEIPGDGGLTIEFKDVGFQYPTGDKPVLKNISFKIGADEKVALVGVNGAGKSTIIKLLLREYLPTSGEIIINGAPIQDLNFRSYTSRIAVLMQNFMLINSITIRQNLLLGNENVSDEKIFEALSVVGFDEHVKKLSKGLDQRLNSYFKDGTELSGGQNQRLSIARTLLKKSDLLVLDEPTSAIDARAEQDIFNELFSKRMQRSALIISHRFSTVRKANTIIVVDDGQIVEAGSHEELMKNDGLYKELFSKQAEGYK